MIASMEDLSDERRAELREQLKEAAPAIRAYLFRGEWIEGRIWEVFHAAETLTPDAIDWNLHTDLERRLLQLYEDYQNAPIGSAEDELAWRARIDSMLAEYITERKR